MAKKKPGAAAPKKPAPQPVSPPPGSRRSFAGIAVVLVLGGLLLAWQQMNPAPPAAPAQQPSNLSPQPAPAPAAATSVTPAIAPVLNNVPAKGDLPPLPLIGGPASRPPQVVQAVYEFAARHPEVLNYVPCFCGCERDGHQGNEDCFIASRDSEGNVTWDAHAMT